MRNLALRPARPSLNNGPVQRRARRAFWCWERLQRRRSRSGRIGSRGGGSITRVVCSSRSEPSASVDLRPSAALGCGASSRRVANSPPPSPHWKIRRNNCGWQFAPAGAHRRDGLSVDRRRKRVFPTTREIYPASSRRRRVAQSRPAASGSPTRAAMTSATAHISATEMPIATALRQKDFGNIVSLPLDQTMQADV
jgi:hypothetical protein